MDTCAHCNRAIKGTGSNAWEWLHADGCYEMLSRCDPVDTHKAYGLNAHPRSVTCEEHGLCAGLDKPPHVM